MPAAALSPLPPSPVDRLVRPWVVFLLCLLAGFAVYGPALGGSFVWDDFYLVRENPFFRSPVFGWEVFRHYLFFDSFSTYYRPVQNWSYMLDYWIWRGSPFGYHCTNIVIHSLSGFLLFLLLRRLLPGLVPKAADGGRARFDLAALLVALVWVVHPIHNAAVAYISGRADSLAALFALSAWLLVLRAMDSGVVVWKKAALGSLAGVALLIGLCSKEIALIWLVLLLVHLFAFDREQPWRVKWTVLGGALAVFACYAVLHALPDYRAPMQDGPSAPWDARVLLMFRALGDYTGLIFLPTQLYMERSISNSAIYSTVAAWRDHSRYEYLSILGLLAALGAIAGCWKKGSGRSWRLFGAVWFMLAFLPISNLFPLNAEVAEHWIYLASIGFLIFLAGVVLALPARGRVVAAWVAVAAIAGLGMRTAIRSGDWIDGETFCARTIADGGATPRILSSLASIYGQRGDLKRQEKVLRRTIAQFPEFPPARMNLGICLSRQRRTSEAEALLGATTHAQADQVARQYPRTWPAAVQLAQLRRDAGHVDEALATIREARGRFPETWELVKAEGELLRGSVGPAAAIPIVQAFAATHWWHYDAQSTLGALRFAAGEPDAAITALRAASALDIYDGRALAGVAEIENQRGRSDVALNAQLEAMDRDPDQPKHYAELASILEKLGRQNAAHAARRKAQLLTLEAQRGSQILTSLPLAP
ncbi:MAG: tetratricopeptide repeat protein [Chthoniobacter sp.]|uniref:tetratricopeptide repeat protein n=1 Tax=Chthoniobacter sp. TaxID=2510640 RepID=UPI0032AB6BF8